MRRRIAIFAVLALVLTLALWGTAKVEGGHWSGRKEHKKRPTLPHVLAGPGAPSEQRLPAEAEPEDGAATLLCTYEGEGDAGELLAEGEGGTFTATGQKDLILHVDPGKWVVTWRQDDRDVELGAVTVDAGDVRTCRLSSAWDGTGIVQNTDGDPVEGAMVYGCNNQRTSTDAEGRFTFHVRRGTCDLQAYWRDGIFSRPSEEVTAGAFDRDRAVTLVVDDSPIAGMGLGFFITSDGVRVTRVTPGSPAEAAGVEPGDLIVKVDGKKVAGLSERDFIAVGTGKEGSTVVLDVTRDDAPKRFQFRRARIEEEDTG
jgi:hypothetical protein